MSSKFKAGENEWQQLNSFAKKDSVDLSSLSVETKKGMLERFPSLLARQIWRTEGFYEVSNQTDPMIKKALETMK